MRQPKARLFTPGPTPIPPEVREAMDGPLVYHRGPDFPDLIRSAEEAVRKVFPTEDPCLFLASSGTGAMEAAVVNTCAREDPVLVVQAGHFGAKWGSLCRAFGLDVNCIDLPWGRSVDPQQVADRLGARPETRAVFATQSETSTGALHGIQAIGEVCQAFGALLIVDGVSSVGAHPLKSADWHVDIALTASQKGLMTPPGVSVLAVGERVWKAADRSDLPRSYFDLRAYREARESGRCPSTPSLSLIAGLKAALNLISEEGVEAVWARHERHARAVRSAVRSLGLPVFPDCPSNALTAAALPDQVDGMALMGRLRERYGITVGGGLGSMRGRMIRISNLGYVDDGDILAVVAALEAALRDLGWSFDPGSGTQAADVELGVPGSDG